MLFTTLTKSVIYNIVTTAHKVLFLTQKIIFTTQKKVLFTTVVLFTTQKKMYTEGVSYNI